jgi:hypothetical protein
MGETVAPGFATLHPNYQILPGATFTKADVKTSTLTFSQVLHNFHGGNAKVLAMDHNINTKCYACHPGNGIECYRGVMKDDGYTCVNCHGTLSQRASSGQTAQPWNAATLPSCNKPAKGVTGSCHSSTKYPDGGVGPRALRVNTSTTGATRAASCAPPVTVRRMPMPRP